MSVEVKAESRLRSSLCATEVIVVKAGPRRAGPALRGSPLVPMSEAAAAESAPATAFDQGTQLGKHYTDAGATVEMLCTKAGAGSLSLGDDLLEIKQAKALPSSD